MSYNSGAVLCRALESVERVLPTAAVAIREHGSDPAALDLLNEVVKSSQLHIRLEFDPSNPGFGAGCNALARRSNADWLLFLNPDAELVAWPWDDTDAPPLRAITGPWMGSHEETMRHTGRSYGTLDEVRRSWIRRPGERPNGRGFVSGAALLVDRSSFDGIGGFDEGYFMFYEDIDLCLRANDAGIRTIVRDEWIVRHEGGHSTRSKFGDSLLWSYDSACRFHRSRGDNLLAYRTYVVIDSAARWLMHAARRDSRSRQAYGQLFRVALRGSHAIGAGG